MKDREKERRDFWIQAWLVVARAETARKPEVPTNWADNALEDYDKRFPLEKTDEVPT